MGWLGNILRWFTGGEHHIYVDRLETDLARVKDESNRRRFFMNALSHDLRTPMNAITLNTDLARCAIADENTELAYDALNTIHENSKACTEMLNTLLEFARFSVNESNDMALCKVSDILMVVLKRFDQIAAAKGIQLKAPLCGDMTILTDRTKLERIVSNLIDNALKFTTAGSVTVNLRTEGDDAMFSVADTGIGVSPEHQELLFGEFFQAGNNERDRQKGFGIGLAITRVLARQLGGDVTLKETGSEGSTFLLRLSGCVRHAVECNVSQTESVGG